MLQRKTRTGERRTARKSSVALRTAAQPRDLRSRIERFGAFSENARGVRILAGKSKDGIEEGFLGEHLARARNRQDASHPGQLGPHGPREADDGGRPITVLIADDHAMVREGMAQMLSLNDDIEVVAQAGDGREAVALARETRPDVVILDVEMPVMGAQAALKRILEFATPPRVIVVTVFADPRLVRELLGLGASAFLAKSASSRELISTVRSVARNPSSDNVIIAVPRTELGEEAPLEGPLSHREVEVLRMVARGAGNKEVSEILHLSETTVKRHLSNVYDKVGVRTRGEAVSKALSEGWVSSWDIVQDD